MSSAPNPAELAEQLRYVRDAVETRDRPRDPSLPLAVLWAALTTAGFALVDLRPAWVVWYWLIVGPLGMVASAWLGRRAARATGVLRRRREAWKHLLHWGLMFPAWAVVIALAVENRLSGQVVGQTMVLVIGLVWFLGGLHLDRRFLAPGALLIVGAALLPYLPLMPWTLLGASTGAALIASAAWVRKPHESAAVQS